MCQCGRENCERGVRKIREGRVSSITVFHSSWNRAVGSASVGTKSKKRDVRVTRSRFKCSTLPTCQIWQTWMPTGDTVVMCCWGHREGSLVDCQSVGADMGWAHWESSHLTPAGVDAVLRQLCETRPQSISTSAGFIKHNNANLPDG
ncbi:unnamed protein product [Arctogadus glacialis]